MCGIAGIISLNGAPIANANARLTTMTRLLHHRGPDSRGHWVSQNGKTGLVNTRLSIVDPKVDMSGPLATPDERYVLTFNGEIYNYREVREQLLSKGVRFRTHTDTEVLLEGLRLEGESFLSRLDGMWAFAFHDNISGQTLLSRDIMGERHILYYQSADELVFASEIKPVLAAVNKTFEVDFDAFAASFLYFSPAPGQTMMKGVERMRASTNMRVSASGKIESQRYARLHPEKWFDFFTANPSEDQVIDQFEELYYKVCKLRLPDEVPFISTLSGGIDSTLTCLYATDFGKTPINTLYGQSTDKPPQKLDTDLDELTASNLTATKLHTRHSHIFLHNDDSIPILKSISENSFEGMYDSGVASFEILARYARKINNKVMLIADGPDETAGGYIVDHRAYHFDRMRRRNPFEFAFLKGVSKLALGRELLKKSGHSDLIYSPLLSYAPFKFQPVNTSWDVDAARHIFSSDLILKSSEAFGVVDPAYSDILPQMDYTQIRALSYASYALPDMFNLRIDKAYMKASVEARLPYQATSMMEFLIAMPAHWRFGADGSQTKYLLRKIVERRIGREIAYRSKHGFSAPTWMSPNVYAAMDYEEVVRSSAIFDAFPFEKKARDYVFLKQSHKDMLWPLYVLSKVHQNAKTRNYSAT